MDGRHPDRVVAGDIGGGAARVLGLEPEVQLLAHGAAELGGDRDEIDRRDQVAQRGGDEREQRQVGFHLDLDARHLHLHRHARAVRQHRAVHLGQGAGRDRLRLEGGEQLLERRAQLGSHALGDAVERYRRHGVLQAGERLDVGRRQEIAAGRRELAQLEHRAAQLEAQLLDALGPAAVELVALGAQRLGRHEGPAALVQAVGSHEHQSLADQAGGARGGAGGLKERRGGSGHGLAEGCSVLRDTPAVAPQIGDELIDAAAHGAGPRAEQRAEQSRAPAVPAVSACRRRHASAPRGRGDSGRPAVRWPAPGSRWRRGFRAARWRCSDRRWR